MRLGHWNQREQRMHLADQWIVLDAEVNSRMPAINERRAHRRPVDLAFQQSHTDRELLWVIGRPPDSLAFARSDRSGRNERRVCLLLFLGLRDLFSFLYA